MGVSNSCDGYELLCRGKRLRSAIKRSREYGQLLLSGGGVFGVYGFVDAGDYHGGVACVFSRRVDGVLIPRAVGKASGRKQVGFDIAQGLIELREVAVGRGL